MSSSSGPATRFAPSNLAQAGLPSDYVALPVIVLASAQHAFSSAMASRDNTGTVYTSTTMLAVATSFREPKDTVGSGVAGKLGRGACFGMMNVIGVADIESIPSSSSPRRSRMKWDRIITLMLRTITSAATLLGLYRYAHFIEVWPHEEDCGALSYPQHAFQGERNTSGHVRPSV